MAVDIVRSVTRAVTESANVTTAVAGALGGAAVNGIIGGVQGTVRGARDGADSGSHSTPAALLAIGAVGATGLVDWPVLLTVGGAALLVRRLSRRDDAEPAPDPAPPSLRRRPADSTPAKAPPRKASARTTTRTRRP